MQTETVPIKAKRRIIGPKAIRRRARLLVDQLGLCWHCGEPMLPVKRRGDKQVKDLCATIEHLLPLGEGGNNSRENTVAVHYKCNQERNQRRGKNDNR